MTKPESLPEPKLRGYLVIYVDGYKVAMKNAGWIISDGEGSRISVPDRLMPPPRHEVGSLKWWEEGHAVGANSRGRLCNRFGAKALKQFKDYDEAVAYAYRRQQKFKNQQHILVYLTVGLGGKERAEVVRSMDEIDAFEARIAAEVAENDRLLAEQRARLDVEQPHLQMLRERFGSSMGWALSDLLRDLKEKGEAAVKAARPRATIARHMKMLREAGLIDAGRVDSQPKG